MRIARTSSPLNSLSLFMRSMEARVSALFTSISLHVSVSFSAAVSGSSRTYCLVAQPCARTKASSNAPSEIPRFTPASLGGLFFLAQRAAQDLADVGLRQLGAE